MSKDSLIKGTLILALAAFTARFLGVVQRVPLKHVLDDAGMGTFGIANNVYLALLTIATLGIPSVLAKLVSEKTELGRLGEADRIYRAAVWFALGTGLLMTALLYFGAPYYAVHIARDPDAVLALRAIAPTLLLFPLVAMMRGYFQGMRMMMPGGLSQIVEQILRVVTAVGLAYLLVALDWGRVWAAAGASFGSVLGGVGAFLVMLYYGVKFRRSRETGSGGGDPAAAGARASVPLTAAAPATPTTAAPVPVSPTPYRRIYADIFKLSVPISLIAITVPLINFIDSSTIIALLQHRPGFDAERAKEVLGILTGRAQSLAGIPPILAIALSQSVLPVVASAFARGDRTEVSKQASLALRLSVLSGLPVVLLISVAARPINGLLFADTEGTGMITMLTVSAMFQILMMTSAAILMGLGFVNAQVGYVFLGIAVKLAGSFLLAPWLGIYGIIGATLLCFAVVNQLNLRALRRIVPYEVLGRRWTGLSLTTVLLAALGLVLDAAAARWLQPFGATVNFALQAAVVCAVLGALYPLLLLWTRAVTQEDVQSFPASLQKLIRKAGRFVRVRERG